jgi:hypothetical protein
VKTMEADALEPSAGEPAEHERMLQAIEAWERDFAEAMSAYRGQRAWRVMLAVRKVYDVLVRGTWKQRLSLLWWIPGFLLGRASGLEEYDLKIPGPAEYADGKSVDGP